MNQTVARATRAFRSALPCRNMSDYRNITELTLNRPPPKMPKGYEKIIKKREIFQADNGLPIFLKGGKSDAILYRLTCFICFTGNVYMFTWIPEFIK